MMKVTSLLACIVGTVTARSVVKIDGKQIGFVAHLTELET